MARRVDFRRYAKIQLEKTPFRYLNVPVRFGIALETDRIFVPLTFDADTGEKRSIRDLKESSNRIRIAGDPGSGKTSLTKKMFRDSCRYAVHEKRSQEHGRLPIAIELKSFIPPKNTTTENALAKWALMKLKEQVTAVQGFDMADLFDSYVAGYGLDVFLDGLDEVASDSYERTANAINALSRLLANKSPANRIYLTMRVQFHQQIHSHFDEEFPLVVQIQPFAPGDIYKFLTRWPFRSDPGANITRIYSDLTDRPTVRDMCTNPLVLAMYVANDQESETESKSADTRTAFYSQVTEELLVARRSRQLGVTARSTLLEQRESILGLMALENLANPDSPANVVPWERAIEIIMSAYNASRETAVMRLHELKRDTGIISEERPNESLRFIHLTFCEYLAAKEYAQGRKNGWAELIKSHRQFASSEQLQLRTRLVEVIPFALGLLARSQRPEALNDVAELKDQLILGRCLLETQLYGHDAWQAYWQTESDYLVKLESPDVEQAGGEWLNRLHLFNVVLSDQAEWATVYGRSVPVSLGEVFNRIVEADRDRLTQVFTSYATQDPAASFRLAEATGMDLIVEKPALVIDNLSSPPFLDIAVERAQRQGEHVVDWALAFTEGSLRNFLVAASLNNIAPGAAMNMSLRDVNSRFQWYPLALPSSHQTPSPSLLTASLTLSANEVAMNPSNARSQKVQVLSFLKPAGRLAPKWIFYLCGGIAMLVPFGIPPLLELLGIETRQNFSIPATFFTLAMFAILIFLGICLMMYPRERALFYWHQFQYAEPSFRTFIEKISGVTGGLMVKLVLPGKDIGTRPGT